MLYVVYGEKVPGGYEVYDSYILACVKHKQIPTTGVYIRKFPNNARFDTIVNMTKDYTKEQSRANLYELLQGFRRIHQVETPKKDCVCYPLPDTGKNGAPAQGESPPSKARPAFDDGQPPDLPPMEFAMDSVMLCLPQVVTCYVDGSYLEGGYGGYAAILLDGGRPLAFLSGSSLVTSSAEAEWRAVKLAFRALDTEHHQVYLYSDNDTVVNVLNGNYPLKNQSPINQQLYHEIVSLSQSHDVIVSHIKGHAGVTLNEFADALAKRKSSMLRAISFHQMEAPSDADAPHPKEAKVLPLRPKRRHKPVVDAMQQTLDFSGES